MSLYIETFSIPVLGNRLIFYQARTKSVEKLLVRQTKVLDCEQNATSSTTTRNNREINIEYSFVMDRETFCAIIRRISWFLIIVEQKMWRKLLVLRTNLLDCEWKSDNFRTTRNNREINGKYSTSMYRETFGCMICGNGWIFHRVRNDNVEKSLSWRMATGTKPHTTLQLQWTIGYCMLKTQRW